MQYSENILGTIGHTPLVKINKITADIPALVLAKVETFNPGNSIKDRMALKMVEDAEKKGLLKPGYTIIEGTSGNTGMGLAIVASIKGYKCIFTTTDKQSKEKFDALRAFGAEVIVCPTNVEPEDPHQDERRENRGGDRQEDHDGVAPGVQEEKHDDRRQHDALDQRLTDAVEHLLGIVRRRVDLVEGKLRELRLNLLQLGA